MKNRLLSIFGAISLLFAFSGNSGAFNKSTYNTELNNEGRSVLDAGTAAKPTYSFQGSDTALTSGVYWDEAGSKVCFSINGTEAGCVDAGGFSSASFDADHVVVTDATGASITDTGELLYDSVNNFLTIGAVPGSPVHPSVQTGTFQLEVFSSGLAALYMEGTSSSVAITRSTDAGATGSGYSILSSTLAKSVSVTLVGGGAANTSLTTMPDYGVFTGTNGVVLYSNSGELRFASGGSAFTDEHMRIETDGDILFGDVDVAADMKWDNTSKSLAFGANPATNGVIRFSNGVSIYSRDGAGTGNSLLLNYGSSNNLLIGDPSVTSDMFLRASKDVYADVDADGAAGGNFVVRQASTKIVLQIDGNGTVQLGNDIASGMATSGDFRVQNDWQLHARDNANTRNIQYMHLDVNDDLHIGGGSSLGPDSILLQTLAGFTINLDENNDDTSGVLILDGADNAIFQYTEDKILTLGDSAATGGDVRVENDWQLMARNNAGTGNIQLFHLNTFDQLLIGGTSNTPGGIITYTNADLVLHLDEDNNGADDQFQIVDGAGTLLFEVEEAFGVRAHIGFYLPKTEGTTPTEPFTCDNAHVAAVAYVDDTDDTGAAEVCVCVDTDDGTTFDWRKVDDLATACGLI